MIIPIAVYAGLIPLMMTASLLETCRGLLLK